MIDSKRMCYWSVRCIISGSWPLLSISLPYQRQTSSSLSRRWEWLSKRRCFWLVPP
jgi:hypothetical protein